MKKRRQVQEGAAESELPEILEMVCDVIIVILEFIIIVYYTLTINILFEKRICGDFLYIKIV